MSPREHRIDTLRALARATGRPYHVQHRIALYEVMTDDEYDEFERRLAERADNRATD